MSKQRSSLFCNKLMEFLQPDPLVSNLIMLLILNDSEDIS